ncbi:MAG: tail fiber protein [Candidatus Microsaccharimonas sp.]
MKGLFRKLHRRDAFTIVELIVVISVIGVLSAIIVVSYSGWQASTRTAQVKSDLNAAAAAMESAVNFTNGATSGYPVSLPNFTSNADVTVTIEPSDGSSYCIDAVSNLDPNIQYYIYSKTKSNGPQEGTCATRPDLTPPAASVALTITTAGGTTATASWVSVTDATSYILQCASDPGFIYNPQQVTVPQASGSVYGTVTGLTPSTTFYCRVKSINLVGSSNWSSTTNETTNANYGSLPVATSIEGYWTSAAPQGFLFEDGSEVSRTTYAGLFAVIGTTYGSGDGATTFNLPDSRGRTSVNRKASDPEFATIGQKTGSKTEQLTIAQMPSHDHGQYVGVKDDANFSGWNFGSYPQYPPGDGPGATPGVATSSTGGNGGHNNIQPSIVKMSAIKFSPIETGVAELPAGTSISGYWTSIPSGYLAEDGAASSRASYPDLFAALGTTYGAGDGSTTFNVPNSQGRASVNLNPTDTEFDSLLDLPGSKTETLTIAQIPAHTHLQYIGQPDDLNFTGVNTQIPPGDGPVIGLNGLTYTPTGGGGSHNNIQPSITKLYAIKNSSASTTTESVATGTSISGYWNSTTPPAGFLPEDGSAVSRTIYANLFAVIGTTYGTGDGSTTFNLPDSRGRVSVNKSISDSEFNTIGEKYGEKSHILTIAELPAHTHQQRIGTRDDGNFGNGVGQYPPSDGPGSYNQGHVTSSTGGDGAHNEIQPSIVKRYFIKY